MYQTKKFQKLQGWSIKSQIGGGAILSFQNADFSKTILVPKNQICWTNIDQVMTLCAIWHCQGVKGWCWSIRQPPVNWSEHMAASKEMDLKCWVIHHHKIHKIPYDIIMFLPITWSMLLLIYMKRKTNWSTFLLFSSKSQNSLPIIH